jgi:RNA polymerase sigma-70 factor (ECF subfamily)
MEADLIQRARQGEPAAWEALMEQHQTAVFRLAYLLLGTVDEAEDVAQETFIRAYRMLNRFDPERPLRPWLLRITGNLARNHHRSLGRYLNALKRFYQSEIVTHEESAERENWQHMEAQALWQAVRRLPMSDQQVIYLRFFLELSIPEMADALNVAHGTIKSRLHRALRRLRGVVEQDFPILWEERIR